MCMLEVKTSDETKYGCLLVILSNEFHVMLHSKRQRKLSSLMHSFMHA